MNDKLLEMEGIIVSDTPDVVVSVNNVKKTFPVQAMTLGRLFSRKKIEGFDALHDVSFQIQRGETVGFLGVNGAGKSTLLQLIAGTLEPTDGNIHIDGRISALLELGAGFNQQWTGRKNAEFYCRIQQMDPSRLDEYIEMIEDFADIGPFFEQPVRTYSSGMYLRVAFAAAVAVQPDIIIVDEALAVGDIKFQNKCFAHFRKMKEAGTTVIFVTHDTVTMSRFCTRGIVLDKGTITFDGPADKAVSHYRHILFGDNADPLINLNEETGSEPQTLNSNNVGKADNAETGELIAKSFAWPPDPKRLKNSFHYNAQESSAGFGVGQIRDVQLLDNNYQAQNFPVMQGQRLNVAMQITSAQKVARPCYGIIIKSKEEIYIYGTTNILLDCEMPSVDKGQTIAICFQINIPFTSGEYFLDVGFSEMVDNELQVIEWRMSVCHFTVKADKFSYGIVDLDAEFLQASQPPASTAYSLAEL